MLFANYQLPLAPPPPELPPPPEKLLELRPEEPDLKECEPEDEKDFLKEFTLNLNQTILKSSLLKKWILISAITIAIPKKGTKSHNNC